MFSRYFLQGININIVDESLYVCIESLRRLGLRADIGQIQTIAANQPRQELIGKHPLRVRRVEGVGYIVGVRAEDQGVSGSPAEIIWRDPVGGKAGIYEGLQRDFGDQRIAVARREGMDDALFSEIARLSIAIEDGVYEIGVEFGESVSDEDGVA